MVKAKKIELIKNVKNYIIKIVGYTIQDLIEVECDGDSMTTMSRFNWFIQNQTKVSCLTIPNKQPKVNV